MCLCVNLIPAFPLDGGQILRSFLTARMGAGMGTEVALRISMAFAVVMAVVDLIFFSNIIVLTLAFLIVVLALQESFQLQATESYDDSFMGYDFSQGYTSSRNRKWQNRARGSSSPAICSARRNSACWIRRQTAGSRCHPRA
jgi:hypothetical protein